MTHDRLNALRNLIKSAERADPVFAPLYAYESEFNAAPEGVSVIIPVHNGAGEMDDLFDSLRNQTIDHSQFEVIFSLNGCTDNSRTLIDNFAEAGDINVIVLDNPLANVAQARNSALKQARFRFTTFVDHDDYISRSYLGECISLGDYRSVVVSNILKIENEFAIEDYAQNVILQGFTFLPVVRPDDITICYRAYTLNAIKTAPTYMLRRASYDETLFHSEDVKYWRDVFHLFTPITVKSPTRRDIYFRKILKNSLSRRRCDFYFQAAPRLALLDQIRKDADRFQCDSPQRKFDAELEQLLLDTLRNIAFR